ncbi:hypothetical protein [Hyphococcus luteus]|uniref:Uncharacterized protein n=1 Tax=Hyphococcus luteus TaxID=2058213 RepID=A0A2S7K003_9PROT|nr:hypothetical protein [Marinicaulis flavus]PQA85845.1 hypothetical protein CW354_20110 [Marinicaulis flavus]
MGDRTYASIAIPKAFEEIVDLWNEVEGDAVVKENSDESIVVYADEEANYGNIDWLEQLLEENAIPYDKEWSRGGGYEPGTKKVRIRRVENGELAVDILEWDESQESIELAEVARLLDAGAFNELSERVRERLSRVTVSTTLEESVFFEEHQILLERLRREKLDRERDACLAATQRHAYTQANANRDLFAEAAMIFTELLFDRQFDDELTDSLLAYLEEVGPMQLRHDIRATSEALHRSFVVTEEAADGTWDRAYDYDWMPTFLKAALRVDMSVPGLTLDENFIRIAWELGLAHKEGRTPDFTAFESKKAPA